MFPCPPASHGAPAETARPIATETCLQCHGDLVTSQAFAASVHGPGGCTSCHIEISDLGAHRTGKSKAGPVQCARCHKEVAVQYLPSVHSLNELGCGDCHADIHSHWPWQGDKRKYLRAWACEGGEGERAYVSSVDLADFHGARH